MAIRNVVTRGYGAGASIPFVVTRGYTIGAALDVSAVISGTLAFTEADVVAGAKQTIVTLTSDTWVAAGTPFNQIRQIVLNGVISAQSEVTGFNVEVRAKEPVTSVVRTSDTVVTITWTAAPDYNIALDETITVTVDDEALVLSANPVTATPIIGVVADTAIRTQHVLSFSSVSQSVLFSAVQKVTTFESVSNSIVIVGIVDPLGFLLQEDGGIILQEDGAEIVLE